MNSETDVQKPPLSGNGTNKRTSLSNTPIIKLEDSASNKRETFNSTVKTDHVSTNLCSLFSNAPIDINRKKRSMYNNSALNPNLWTRKKKLGNFKKRKKKYRKSVIGKGIHVANHQKYTHHSNLPDTSHNFLSTHYFQDHQS